MSGRTRLEVKGASVKDEIKQSLYDTIDIVAAENPQSATPRRFFASVQNKDRSLTNLQQNSILPSETSFRILAMSLDAQNLYALNRQALGLIAEHSALTLNIGNKEYYTANGIEWSGRVKNQVFDPAAATAYQHHGNEKERGIVLAPRHFIDIPPLFNFDVTWVVSGMSAAEITASTPAANTKLRYKCELFGLLRRPVQ